MNIHSLFLRNYFISTVENVIFCYKVTSVKALFPTPQLPATPVSVRWEKQRDRPLVRLSGVYLALRLGVEKNSEKKKMQLVITVKR